ncbi:PIG-L deacetylase family protein [Aestuariimicrobium kwangyangense]|uniref:PIG-L deacetylase family protein n=1 Tax=Aestuariimicrobium kwangyangense TaxID=396389 RepID=UPI0003B6FBE1|nr:PIG-L deacetylase family protein [Aestuariimicrobium kwangyangense]
MQIETFTAEVKRVLCVVAHPDDMEYGASAAVAHWTNSGAHVAYLLLTHGEAGMQRSPDEAARVRPEEQRAACATVGVDQLTILDHPDGVLEMTLDLRRDIAREIRRFEPDTVLTSTWDVEPTWGGLNQADHRVAGLSVVDAIAAAGNRWIFPELITEGFQPHAVTRLMVTGSTPTHAVVVDRADVDRAVASLQCHTAYLADLPNHPVPSEFIPEALAGAGQIVGADHAVAFRVFEMR